MAGVIDCQADTKTRLWLVLPGTAMQIWKGQGKGHELQGGTEAPRNCSWGSSSSAVPVDQEWGPQGAAQPQLGMSGGGSMLRTGLSCRSFMLSIFKKIKKKFFFWPHHGMAYGEFPDQGLNQCTLQ